MGPSDKIWTVVIGGLFVLIILLGLAGAVHLMAGMTYPGPNQ